jgi:hypothetical protein
VDVLIEQGDRLIPVEIKSGQTVTRDSFANLENWVELAGSAAGRPWLVYGGDTRQSRSEVEVVPWREIGAITA